MIVGDASFLGGGDVTVTLYLQRNACSQQFSNHLFIKATLDLDHKDNK